MRHVLTGAVLGVTLVVLLARASALPPPAPVSAPPALSPSSAPVTSAPASPAAAVDEGTPQAPAVSGPAAFDLGALPRPSLDAVLPAPQTRATLDDARAVGRSVFATDGVVVVARPQAELTPGYATPDDTSTPILALESTTLEQPAAWLVTAKDDGWLQVLVPLGRGALPSVDPPAVNGRAVWVRLDGVELEPNRASVMVDVSERTATITDTGGTVTRVVVGVGRENDTDTPRGLGALVGFAASPHGYSVAVTSMQSTRLDGYDGASYAAFALHPDPEHGAALGKARSNGCIRMDASDYHELVDPALPSGTPVWVVD